MRKTLLILLLSFMSPSIGWSQVFVSTYGSDANEGTSTKPLQSLAMALRKAREMRRLNDPATKNGIEIILGEGVYKLSEPLFLRPEDAGTNESPTIIRAEEGAHPILSGGVPIGGWKKAGAGIPGLPKSSVGKVWVLDISMLQENFNSFRQLWVNGNKAVRARERNGDSMSRILSWDHASQTCWIPKPKGVDLTNAKGVEMFIHQWWAIANLRIKSMKMVRDSIQLSFHQPESRIQSEHPWPAPWISKKTGNSAFYLTNAIQFLDEPGEWYLDQDKRKLYYYPRAGDYMSKAIVIAPLLENLLKIEGTIDDPVAHIYFKGISFQYTGWMRPSLYGHVPLQAGMYLLDAYKLKFPGTPDKKGLENQAWIGRPGAAVEISNANHIHFENCRFEHLASTALDFKTGTSQDMVVGNLFKDVGGSGILVGKFSDESFETHRAYHPKDEREISSEEYIGNNLITDVTNEDWGCVGIGAGYVRGIRIEHNDVSNVSYSGISLGWGWTKSENVMRNNRIIGNKITHYAKHMYDVAGIYTLSAQPGTLISYNCVDSIYKAPYAHDPNHWFYLYTDEGSSYITVKDNWCPAEKFLQNANGPGNSWDNNGPMVKDSIKKTAGLEEKFRFLLKERTTDPRWPINYFIPEEKKQTTSIYAAINKPLIIEVIIREEGQFSEEELLHLYGLHSIPARDVYNWKNHYVGFGSPSDTGVLKKQIVSKFPGSQVIIYADMFYVFNRERCDDKREAKEWDNIVLTANLVSDAKLQREYLDYHARQYEQWPEVSKGFCNAGFQQLLVFRNGRQLMLIISIPKGKNLDELNPKTTENNPRMNDWNVLMKKYQEGINGTQPGEGWVFLKHLAEK
jgi:hypothetical protein